MNKRTATGQIGSSFRPHNSARTALESVSLQRKAPRGLSAGTTPLSRALKPILAELKRADLAEQSVGRMAEIIVRFTSYIEKGFGLRNLAEVAEEHVEGFVFASVWAQPERRRPSPATMHLRRSALRLYFRLARQLGLFVGDPTVDLVLPARSCLTMRPLTDDEIALCRSFSLHTPSATRQPAAWALAEATARTSEIPHIRVSDFQPNRGQVWIHGGGRTEGRWGFPSTWGLAQLSRRAHDLNAKAEDPLLVYEGGGSAESRQASSCVAISETLLRAGLAGEPDVRPGSVAAWAGVKIFSESGLIQEVARRLGVRSLDRAAGLIGWDWKNEAEAG